MKRVRAICLGEEKEYWDDMKYLIRPFAEYMVHKIKEKKSLLISSDYFNRTIKLV